MGTETALHILCKCVTLDELRFHRLDKHFMRTSDYDSFPLCKILYFVRGMGLLVE
jgi:hypothetical protein